MSEWWTYSLSDFLLFSADTYYRLFELYNEAVWPAHVLVVAVSVLAIFLVFRPRPWSGRVLFLALGVCWLWVAWGYHITHFSTINWVASYYAVGFAIEGILLLLNGGFSKDLQVMPAATVSSRIGLGLIGFGLVIQPFIGPLSGRPWAQVEIAGLAPDPTVVLTLGLVLLASRSRWMLMPIPLCWCLISWATLWTMGQVESWMMLGAAIITLVAVWRRQRHAQ